MGTRADILWTDFHHAALDSRTCRAQLAAQRELLVELRTKGGNTADIEWLVRARLTEVQMLAAIRDRSFDEIIDFLAAEMLQAPERAHLR